MKVARHPRLRSDRKAKAWVPLCVPRQPLCTDFSPTPARGWGVGLQACVGLHLFQYHRWLRAASPLLPQPESRSPSNSCLVTPVATPVQEKQFEHMPQAQPVSSHTGIAQLVNPDRYEQRQVLVHLPRSGTKW